MVNAAMTQNTVAVLQDGSKRKMDFDMGAMAQAEMIYEDKFGKSVGVDAIIEELIMGKARAMMAFAYGAMVSAGEKLTWAEFCKSVWTFENYEQLHAVVLQAVLRMMHSGDTEGSAEKNADSRGAN